MQLSNMPPTNKKSSSPKFIWLLGFLVVIYTLFLVTVSLMPFERFHNPSLRFPHELLHTWQHQVELFDVVQNILAYIPYGCLLFMLLYTIRHRYILHTLIATTLCFVLSLGIESAQCFNPVRTSSLVDVIFNAAGGFIGALTGIIFALTRSFWFMQLKHSFKYNSNRLPIQLTAMIGILFWAGYHLYPFTPSIHPSHMKYALKPVLTFVNDIQTFNNAIFIKYLWQGCILAILSSLILKPQRRFGLLCIFIFSVMAVKMIIVSRYLSVESMLGLLGAICVMEGLFQLAGVCRKSDPYIADERPNKVSIQRPCD